MKSFLHAKRPILTAMIPTPYTIPEAYASIAYGLENGADAFGLQLEALARESRTAEALGGLIRAMGDKPAYVTNYKRNHPERDENELISELLEVLDLGATLIDLPGDTYCTTDGELTRDTAAVAKQKELIREIHDRGGEVLLSSHVLRYKTPEEVLEIAERQIERGADVAKIVTSADSDEQLFENLRANYLLKSRLGAPFLFLCNGSHAYLHRCFGPSLGSSLFLCVSAPLVRPGVKQPSLKKAAALLDATVPSYNYK